ncbi:MAG: NADH-quinone oxidoreductase subunit A [Myxococcaceae bacterium]
MQSWAPVLIFLAIGSSVGALMVLGSRLLSVKSRRQLPTAPMTYECGEEPATQSWIRFHPRFYVLALVFILFDVETVFLVPWALNTRTLGTFAIIEMIVFVVILLLGWVYALRKGAIQWQ